MNYLTPIYREDRNDYDSATRTLRFRANRKETKNALAHPVTLTRSLVDRGELQGYGCDCTHCRNDWDCCGRMTVSGNSITRVRRGFVITQHLSRNV